MFQAFSKQLIDVAQRRGARWTAQARRRQFLRVAYTSPRQVVLLTAIHEGRRNVWPIDWQMPTSMEPPRVAVSLTNASFGRELVSESGAFVLNFMDARDQDLLFACGDGSGRQQDRFERLGIETCASQTVEAPRIAAAVGALECVVEQSIRYEDRTLFTARVMCVHEPGPTARLFHLAAHLWPGDYER